MVCRHALCGTLDYWYWSYELYQSWNHLGKLPEAVAGGRLYKGEKAASDQFFDHIGVLARGYGHLSGDQSADKELERQLDHMGDCGGTVPGGDCSCKND